MISPALTPALEHFRRAYDAAHAPALAGPCPASPTALPLPPGPALYFPFHPFSDADPRALDYLRKSVHEPYNGNPRPGAAPSARPKDRWTRPFLPSFASEVFPAMLSRATQDPQFMRGLAALPPLLLDEARAFGQADRLTWYVDVSQQARKDALWAWDDARGYSPAARLYIHEQAWHRAMAPVLDLEKALHHLITTHKLWPTSRLYESWRRGLGRNR